jgi:hypothetical protein
VFRKTTKTSRELKKFCHIHFRKMLRMLI